jgi:hypothetical protein
MNSELEKMWKEVVVAIFKGLSWVLLEGTERNHQKLQDSRFPDRGSNTIFIRTLLLFGKCLQRVGFQYQHLVQCTVGAIETFVTKEGASEIFRKQTTATYFTCFKNASLVATIETRIWWGVADFAFDGSVWG